MWPAADSLIYSLGIGGQAVPVVLSAPRLRVRLAVVVAIYACYLVGTLKVLRSTCGSCGVFSAHMPLKHAG